MNNINCFEAVSMYSFLNEFTVDKAVAFSSATAVDSNSIVNCNEFNDGSTATSSVNPRYTCQEVDCSRLATKSGNYKRCKHCYSKHRAMKYGQNFSEKKKKQQFVVEKADTPNYGSKPPIQELKFSMYVPPSLVNPNGTWAKTTQAETKIPPIKHKDKQRSEEEQEDVIRLKEKKYEKVNDDSGIHEEMVDGNDYYEQMNQIPLTINLGSLISLTKFAMKRKLNTR